MLNNASSIQKGCYACQWLDNVDMHTFVCMQNVIKIYVVIKEFWTFSLTTVTTDGRTRTVITDREIYLLKPSSCILSNMAHEKLNAKVAVLDTTVHYGIFSYMYKVDYMYQVDLVLFCCDSSMIY